jgi:hypothetical protein
VSPATAIKGSLKVVAGRGGHLTLTGRNRGAERRDLKRILLRFRRRDCLPEMSISEARTSTRQRRKQDIKLFLQTASRLRLMSWV